MGDLAPGYCTVVFDRERDLRVEEHGFADLEIGGLAFARATRSRWFSVTKLVTAIAILRLVDEGRLDLDASVAEVLPFFRPRPSHPPVTARHLLAHASGLRNPLPLGWAHASERGSRSASVLTRDVFARSRRLRSVPGTTARYTNLGYLVLGELVSTLRGEPYADHVRSSLFVPLGMQHTSFDPEPAAVGHERAWSLRSAGLAAAFVGRARLRYVRAGWIGVHPIVLDGEAYGGVVGSTDDLVRFGRALMRGDLLSRGLFAEMGRGQFGSAYGLGPWILGGGWLGHTGEAAGYRAELRVHSQRGIGVAVLANAGTAPVEDLARAALARVAL